MVPTFANPDPQDLCNLVYDERPENLAYYNPEDFMFVFIIDRSGSMKDKNRIKMATDALQLFVRSLPPDCNFNIVSFGGKWDAMFSKSEDG